MRLYHVLVLLCQLLLCRLCYSYDLVSAYKSALAYNADYLAQVAATDATNEAPIQARSQLLPQLSAVGGYNEAYLGSNGMSVTYSQPTVGAQFSIAVIDFSKFSTYTKSKFLRTVGALQLKNSSQQLIVKVAQSYFNLLYASDSLRAIRMNKDAFYKQYKQARLSFDVGSVTIADVNDAQAGYDSAVAQEIQAVNDLINYKNIFRNLTGLNPDLVEPLIDNIVLVTPIPDSVDEWSNIAMSANLNIQVAKTQLDMAAEDMKISKSGHMPTLNLAGNYQLQGSAIINGADSAQASAFASQLMNIPGVPLSSYATAAVGLQLTIPVSSGGGISSQVRQSIDNYEVAQQQLIAVERLTNQNIRNDFYQVKNGVSFVKAQMQSLQSAKSKLDSDKIGYRVGIRNAIDLINSQKNYANVLLNYNQARYQYLTYQLQLDYLSGKLDMDMLRSINRNILTQAPPQ